MKEILEQIHNSSCDFLKEAYEYGKTISVGKTAFMRATGCQSEEQYKRVQRLSGKIMYHFHLCCESMEGYLRQMKELQEKLADKNLHLDRFGISIDYSMALPKEIREANKAGGALYFAAQEDWDKLGQFSFSQPHLGDNMIGSPACDETVEAALRAGVTTMGNISQFFGWDYPECPDVEARTQATVKAIAYMAANRESGTLIHSNLDDGYGDKAPDLGTLLGCALLEKYIIEDLMKAKIAHSFGDMFHSPRKRLVFLSALKAIHGEEICGSMIFANKLGRNQKVQDVNLAHLSAHLLIDMVGQAHYATGHAVTTMANQGLTTDVSVDEIVKTLEYARELEAYIPELSAVIDFDRIDEEAYMAAERGRKMCDAVLAYFDNFIDITNPYEMMLAIKKIGMEKLVSRFAVKEEEGIIEADYNLYTH